MSSPTPAGVTPSGLRYPEPTDPVAQGAAAIRNLAEDVTAQGPASLGGPATTGNTIGTAGVVAWTPAFTIPAAPAKRLIQVHLMGYTTSIGTGPLWFMVRLNGTDVQRVDTATAKTSAFTTYTWALAANTTATVQGTAQSSVGNAVVPADGRFAWIAVYSLGGIS